MVLISPAVNTLFSFQPNREESLFSFLSACFGNKILEKQKHKHKTNKTKPSLINTDMKMIAKDAKQSKTRLCSSYNKLLKKKKIEQKERK